MINNVCLNKVQQSPSCEEISSDSRISSDSQIGMMHVRAAQLAVSATKVADDGSNADVFFGWE